MITLKENWLCLGVIDHYDRALSEGGFERLVISFYEKLISKEGVTVLNIDELSDLYLEEVQRRVFDHHNGLEYDYENDRFMAIADDLYLFTAQAVNFTSYILVKNRLAFGREFYPQGKSHLKEMREVYTPQISLFKKGGE